MILINVKHNINNIMKAPTYIRAVPEEGEPKIHRHDEKSTKFHAAGKFAVTLLRFFHAVASETQRLQFRR